MVVSCSASDVSARSAVAAACGVDPVDGLDAVVELRALVEVFEALQVDNARRLGWSWSEIAARLGVTKQAVHYKHGRRWRAR